MKMTAILALALIALPLHAQTVVTVVQAEPQPPRAEIAFSYGDMLRFSVETTTRAQADELRWAQVRIFRGTLQEKLDNGRNSNRVACHYYNSILLRPVVTRGSETKVLLDFPIRLGSHWASESGQPKAQRYVVVFEKVGAHSLAAGRSKAERFAILPSRHNDYFSSAVEMIIDPGTLNASMVRASGSAPALQDPEQCSESKLDKRVIRIATVRPVSEPEANAIIASARRVRTE